MPVFSLTRNYLDGTILTQAQIDALVDSVETALNTTKLDTNNIQSGGVDTANIASNAVTNAKLATDSVTTVKIADANVTTAKLASGVVDASTLEIASGNIRVKDSGIVTAKIADGAVTQAKRAALGQQISASCGAFGTTSGSFADVTNLSVTITTTGRPVVVGLTADGTASSGFVSNINLSNSSGPAHIKLLRGATVVSYMQLSNSTTATSIPVSSYSFIEVPAAGTYTYKLQMATSTGTASLTYACLYAYEL